MPLLAFPEYAPDITPFGEQDSQNITNAYPRKDGYGPVGALSTFTAALPAVCRGFFTARGNDGSITIFAATSTRIFKLNNTDLSWIPVSKYVALTSISNGTPAVLTLASHGLSIGDAIQLSTDGGLPAPLTTATVYYVIAAGFSANAFEIALTPGGTAINTTTAGSGTHSYTAQYTAPPAADQWQFAQFNNFVIAVQINTAPQVYDLTTSTAFAALAGSPPAARYIAVVNRFVVLSGLGTSFPYRVQWSGLNATTTWTSGVNSSDFQDLPDGGLVRSVGGGEYGLITQDGCIRRMVFAPGSSYVFQIERIVQDQGIFGPLSLVRAGDRLFYCGTDGFKMLAPGAYPVPIGKERVDRTFFADVDTGYFNVLLGGTDPNTTRVFWAYKSLTGTANQFDKVLIYDYALDRWALITGWSGEYVGQAVRPGYTLDGLDTLSGSIDALTIGSLDDLTTTTQGRLAFADTSHKLAFSGAQNLEAIMETSEQEVDTQARVRVQGSRPDTDAPTCYISIATRENLQSTPSYSTERAVLGTGYAPANVSTRLARAKLRIPAQTNWIFARGVEPIFRPEGRF